MSELDNFDKHISQLQQRLTKAKTVELILWKRYKQHRKSATRLERNWSKAFQRRTAIERDIKGAKAVLAWSRECAKHRMLPE